MGRIIPQNDKQLVIKKTSNFQEDQFRERSKYGRVEFKIIVIVVKDKGQSKHDDDN